MTLDLELFEKTPLAREPFEHLVVRGFVKLEARKAINDDYPKLQRPGSFPLSETTFGPKFKRRQQARRAPRDGAKRMESMGNYWAR